MSNVTRVKFGRNDELLVEIDKLLLRNGLTKIDQVRLLDLRLRAVDGVVDAGTLARTLQAVSANSRLSRRRP